MSTTFASLGVPEAIATALANRGITEAFPIQVATIPPALAGRDLCGKAPTGSGKTIAFGVPMVARVTRSAPKKPHGLVLAPTRELAIQVSEELENLNSGLRILAVYGGAGIEPQIKKLRAGIDIVVATPGRLIDLLDRNCCDLRSVTFAVVDEADRMADMGFLPDVKRILDETRDDRQTVLFSATLDGAIDSLVQRYQKNPVVHEVEDEESGDVVHHFWISERTERVALLAQIVDRLGPTVVFSRTKHGSDRIAKQLGNAGIKAAAIHGNRSQAQRERALEAFHRGDVQALVATDVAARGIHVDGVMGVVHFDLPADHKDYIHRSGRTGRAGMTGTVVTLIDKSQRKDAVKIKKGAGVDVEIGEPDVLSLPEGPQQAFRPTSGRNKARVKDLTPPVPSNSPDRNKVRAQAKTQAQRQERSQRDWDEPTSRPSRPRNDRPQRSDRQDRPAGQDRTGSTDRTPSRSGNRTDDRSGARPSDLSRNPSRSAARPGRTERSDHGSPRSSRPEDRSERSERQARWANEEASTKSSRENRADRRNRQFTDAERDARAAANEKAEANRAKQRAASKAGQRPSTGSTGSGDRSLPSNVPGGSKVRPSGASRRKAKRQELSDAGEPVPAAKKRRSGKPRPPASQRTR
ncbi:DEAD/DEAH box helicase [Aquihabitans sp. McL0605]|uniref:DEAD/DEAH box helicase n=1 Tax=Aquihabitans sp. McL0605 TaxID=3415671 RepID=UPI003CF374D1